MPRSVAWPLKTDDMFPYADGHLSAVNNSATIRRFEAYATHGCVLPPPPPSPPCELLDGYKYLGSDLVPSRRVASQGECCTACRALPACVAFYFTVAVGTAGDGAERAREGASEGASEGAREGASEGVSEGASEGAKLVRVGVGGACQLLKSIGGGQAATGVVSGAPLRR